MFVRPQRPAAPWSQHNWWGQYTTATTLPNRPGSDIQVSSEELQRGDVAWVEDEGLLYVCTDPTAGASVWAPIGTGGGGAGEVDINAPNWFDDFLAVNERGDLFWNEIANGALGGVVVNATTEAEIAPARPGILGCQTGTSAGGRGGIYLGRVSGSDGGRTFAWPGPDGTSYIEWLIRLSALSDGADDFTVSLGWDTNTGGGFARDGVLFVLFSTGNWQIAARDLSDGGGTTLIPTSFAPSTDWTRFRIDWDPVTGATFSAGPSPGALTVIGNIPAADPNIPLTPNRTGPLAKIQKNAGNNNRLMFVDYAKFGLNMTTGR